ncbi:MAG: hypothetical protein ACM3W7_10020, partial [Acidobacteriota bacterium]
NAVNDPVIKSALRKLALNIGDDLRLGACARRGRFRLDSTGLSCGMTLYGWRDMAGRKYWRWMRTMLQEQGIDENNNRRNRTREKCDRLARVFTDECRDASGAAVAPCRCTAAARIFATHFF